MVRAGYFSIQSTTSHARLATGSLTVMAAFYARDIGRQQIGSGQVELFG